MSFSMSFMKLFLLLIYIFLTGDCHDSVGRKNRCVTGAIYNYTMQLKSGYQDSISVEKCKLITNGYYIFRCYNITFPILNGNNMGCFPLLIIDNLTEALMFLSHFIGDVHQVCSFYWEIETHTVIHFSFKFLFLVPASTCWFHWRWRWEHNNSALVPSKDKPTPCTLSLVSCTFSTIWSTNLVKKKKFVHFKKQQVAFGRSRIQTCKFS